VSTDAKLLTFNPAREISPSTAPGPAANPPPPVLPADLPASRSAISLLGVDYIHLKTEDGGDLYLTRFGLPFWKNLLPENWYAREWFEAKRERLEGTSTVYKVPTRPVNGKVLHLVVKWSRVGEMVPFDTLTVNKFIQAEFNSPFEEFSLLMELRRGEAGPAAIRIRTQLPLAIYVPSERLQLWQTGRSEDKIRAKVTRHPGVEIDILRQYVVLFGWIKGLDAVDTAEKFGLEGRAQAEFLARVTSLVTHELWQKGFRVVDMKPAHIICARSRTSRCCATTTTSLPTRWWTTNCSNGPPNTNRPCGAPTGSFTSNTWPAGSTPTPPIRCRRICAPRMCWGWITFLAAPKARADCSGWWARTRTCSIIFCRNAGGARPRKNCPPATRFSTPAPRTTSIWCGRSRAWATRRG
jgi:hypothetical protein